MANEFGCPVTLKDDIRGSFTRRVLKNINVTDDDVNIDHRKATYNWSIGIDLLLENLDLGTHMIHIHKSIPEYDHYEYDFTYIVEVKPDVVGQY